MFLPDFKASMTVEIKPSTTASVSTFVNPVADAMTSTISAFVKLPPGEELENEKILCPSWAQ
jgi:hypothetical protein